MLSTADMDVFALSAEHASVSHSIHSLPTSFVSGYAVESVNNQESLYMEDTASRRAYMPPSLASSFSLSLSSDSISLRNARGRGRINAPGEEITCKRRRRRSSPGPDIPHSQAVSTVMACAAANDNVGERGNKSTRFTRIKAFGNRIKKAFGIKSKAILSQGEIGVITTTAVTAVEYEYVSA